MQMLLLSGQTGSLIPGVKGFPTRNMSQTSVRTADLEVTPGKVVTSVQNLRSGFWGPVKDVFFPISRSALLPTKSFRREAGCFFCSLKSPSWEMVALSLSRQEAMEGHAFPCIWR